MVHDPRPSRTRVRIAWTGIAVVALACVASVVALTRWPELDDAYGAFIGIFFAAAIVAVIVLGVWCFTSSISASRFTRLERGEGVLGRWIVEPVAWRELMRARRELDRQPEVLATHGEIPDEAPAGGMEIVVSDDAIYIGDRFWYSVGGPVMYDVQFRAGWIDFPAPSDNTVTHTARVPVITGGEAVAEAIVRYFNRPMTVIDAEKKAVQARPVKR